MQPQQWKRILQKCVFSSSSSFPLKLLLLLHLFHVPLLLLLLLLVPWHRIFAGNGWLPRRVYSKDHRPPLTWNYTDVVVAEEKTSSQRWSEEKVKREGQLLLLLRLLETIKDCSSVHGLARKGGAGWTGFFIITAVRMAQWLPVRDGEKAKEMKKLYNYSKIPCRFAAHPIASLKCL